MTSLVSSYAHAYCSSSNLMGTYDLAIPLNSTALSMLIFSLYSASIGKLESLISGVCSIRVASHQRASESAAYFFKYLVSVS